MWANSSTSELGEDSSEKEISRKTQANTKICKGYNQHDDNGRGFSYYGESDCNLSERERYRNSINSRNYRDTISIRDRNENLIVEHPAVKCRNILFHYNLIHSSQCQCEALGSRQLSGVLDSCHEDSVYTLDSDL